MEDQGVISKGMVDYVVPLMAPSFHYIPILYGSLAVRQGLSGENETCCSFGVSKSAKSTALAW